MKKNSIAFTLFLATMYIVLSSDMDGAAHHGHGNLTGSPTGAVGHCQTSSCHGANNALTIVQLQVLDTSTMLPITTYNALQSYLVTITGNDTDVATVLPGFGFQASTVLGNHTQAGTYIIPSNLASSIHTYPCGSTTVVEHTIVLHPTSANSNRYAIQFYWQAPPPASDSVTFYSVLNAVNGDGGKSGDYPNAAPNVTIYEDASTATCGIPTNIADSLVSPTSAFLYWTSVPGAITYNIQYRPVGTSTWSNTTATTNSKTITGLTPSTTYEFSVQTVCSGSPSLFSLSNDTLTTLISNGVSVINNNMSDFSVFPNPSSVDANIAYHLLTPQRISIAVYDILGNKVAQPVDKEMQNVGAHTYKLAVPAAGVYFVSMLSGNTAYTRQFVKL
ncbi:MAG: choice-of-anchor V domain-containing protein [Bacteroidota bacterium]